VTVTVTTRAAREMRERDGLVVQSPSFINEGEVVRIGTENGDYLGRATS
jgi:hypothetical protein